MQKLIWLSDLHYDAQALVQSHDPRVRLEAAIDLINAHHADAACCVVTGDMVETASDASYAALRAALGRLSVPVLPLTGNHDSHALLRTHLPVPEGAMPDFVQYAVGLDGHVLIALDTLDEGKDSGLLCEARLNWLQTALEAAGDTPVSIFMHHPPVKLGLAMLDPDNLANAEAFWEIVDRYPSVRTIFAGHVHRPTTSHRKGVTITTLPSALYQALPENPPWNWSTFVPAREVPRLGVVHIGAEQTTIQFEDICAYEHGGAP